MNKELIDVHLNGLIKLWSNETNEKALLRLEYMKLFSSGISLSKEYEIALDKAIEVFKDRVMNEILVGDLGD